MEPDSYRFSAKNIFRKKKLMLEKKQASSKLLTIWRITGLFRVKE
jgi:hypothetical protein